jgi:CMD domain protein
VIAQLAGLTTGSAAARAWAERGQVRQAAQATYALLLEPAEPGGLSLAERALIALRVASLTPSAAGVAWYQARLGLFPVDAATLAAAHSGRPDVPPRLAALLRHTDLLTTAPSQATPDDIAALKAAGFSPADIVTISQLIALVSFQVRAAATLRALEDVA